MKNGKIASLTCKCISHANWCLNVTSPSSHNVYHIKRSKVIKKSVVSYLKTHSYLSPKSNYVCKGCAVKAEYLMNGKSDFSKTLLKDHLLGLISCLNSYSSNDISSISTDLWCNLVRLICSKVAKEMVYNDGENIKSLYNNIAFLQEVDSKQYIMDRNPIVISFLEGTSGLNFNGELSALDYFKVASVVENVYSLRNFNWVLPINFIANFMQSCISGSKIVTTLNGKLNVGGSYPTYQDWLRRHGSQPLECPQGDLDIYIDNIGCYIVKNYRISVEKNDPAHVITTCLHLTLNDETKLQNDPELKPIKWNIGRSEKNIQNQMNLKILSHKEYYRRLRYNYISFMINEYLSGKGEVESQIEQLCLQQKRKCINVDCGRLYSNLKRKCDSCGFAVKIIEISKPATKKQTTSLIEKYIHIGEKKNLNLKQMKMGEPILFNPNSHINIEHILNALKENVGISIKRQWTFVGADGPPYCLASRLIERNTEKYDWVSMVPGLGHLNMTQLKALFRVLDKICFEPLGRDVLKFKSNKAYNYLLEAKDNHKAWETFEVFLHGTMLELIEVYASETKENVTPRGFLAWQKQIGSPTLNLMCQIVLTHALGIYVQRVGDRNNDFAVSEAGRYSFFNMFYGFNHPIYREIEYRDLRNKVLYPDVVKKQRQENLSFSTTSNSSKHQGGDFQLEQKIQRQKMYAPKGIISSKTWQQIARSLDKIDSILQLCWEQSKRIGLVLSF